MEKGRWLTCTRELSERIAYSSNSACWKRLVAPRRRSVVVWTAAEPGYGGCGCASAATSTKMTTDTVNWAVRGVLP